MVFPLTFHSNLTFFFFPSFTYICGFLGGVLLLENPKGDNRLDLVKLKNVVTSIFGVKNTELAIFHGETGMCKVKGIHLCPLT